MTPRHHQVLDRFYKKHLGDRWKDSSPRWISPAEALDALWALNSLFEPHYHLIDSLPFEATYEGDADRALERLAMGEIWTEKDPTPSVGRVLVERHTQSMAVLQTNDLHGTKSVSAIPESLPPNLLPLALALFLQYEMKLILPTKQALPTDIKAADLPSSLTRH